MVNSEDGYNLPCSGAICCEFSLVCSKIKESAIVFIEAFSIKQDENVG